MFCDAGEAAALFVILVDSGISLGPEVVRLAVILFSKMHL